jgi:hypothetical protein
MNNQARHWSFTWNTNVKSHKLPNKDKLKVFMDTNAENAVFQLEKGLIKGKEHYQGCFTLIGPRRSNSYVLKTFENRFENVSGLSIQIISNLEATLAYTTKSETRVAGPWYCGSL